MGDRYASVAYIRQFDILHVSAIVDILLRFLLGEINPTLRPDHVGVELLREEHRLEAGTGRLPLDPLELREPDAPQSVLELVLVVRNEFLVDQELHRRFKHVGLQEPVEQLRFLLSLLRRDRLLRFNVHLVIIVQRQHAFNSRDLVRFRLDVQQAGNYTEKRGQ